jgi:hypothetical protein
MTPALAAARREIQNIVDGLESLRFRMLGVQGTLPEPATEIVKLMDLEAMDATAEISAVIGCVLNDCIGPAIRDLRDALTETEASLDDGATKP